MLSFDFYFQLLGERPELKPLMSIKWCSYRGGGGTPYSGLYGEAPPDRGTFFRPPRPWGKWGGGVGGGVGLQKFFSALGPQFGLKIRKARGSPGPSATDKNKKQVFGPRDGVSPYKTLLMAPSGVLTSLTSIKSFKDIGKRSSSVQASRMLDRIPPAKYESWTNLSSKRHLEEWREVTITSPHTLMVAGRRIRTNYELSTWFS